MDYSNFEKVRIPPKLLCNIDTGMDTETDRISNLPGHIVDRILSHLSIKDVVRMSVLSSKWRFKWASIPNLVFDNQCFSSASQDQAIIRSKLVHIIDRVLLLHIGTIYKFKLSHKDLQAVHDIDAWILHVSRCSVKEFILEIWKGQRYRIPSCLFACKNLIHLELFNCMLRPPSAFRGFQHLKSLDLQHISMTQDAFEHLIFSCPLLERLTLMNYDGFNHLKIHAPNLQFFDVGGVFEDVSFLNTFQLAIISIGLYINIRTDVNPVLGSSSNLVKFFHNLPRIQRLEVQSYFLKYLAVGNVPGQLPRSCAELCYLSIRINFHDLKESSAALCLLRSSPNLVELEMLARPEEENAVRTVSRFWLENKCQFDKLKLVRVADISGARPELDFMKFLLANSPALEKMTVKPMTMDGAWELLKELLRFKRASSQAELFILDP